jgi:transposase
VESADFYRGASYKPCGCGKADTTSPDVRTKAPTQDGRALRRYLRRWKVERLSAWVQNFRRVLTRWEYHVSNYLGFVQLACIRILLRNYF